MEAKSNENFMLQKDELEALSSIYGEDFTLEDEDPPTFNITVRTCNENEALLTVIFQPGYPTESPPTFQISIPWMRGQTKLNVCSQLEQLYMDHVGESIVYLWVEKHRDLLEMEGTNPSGTLNPDRVQVTPGIQAGEGEANLSAQIDSENKLSSDDKELKPFENPSQCHTSKDRAEKLSIFTGEPFTDRKSTFQAHVASISQPSQVRTVLDELCNNKKIASATHNMYAYRIWNDRTDSFIQDCEDDGENHAGSRLLHLLQVLDCRNVVVVVSRWYGGVQLHGDRFKNINNVARHVLENHGFIKAKLKK